MELKKENHNIFQNNHIIYPSQTKSQPKSTIKLPISFPTFTNLKNHYPKLSMKCPTIKKKIEHNGAYLRLGFHTMPCRIAALVVVVHLKAIQWSWSTHGHGVMDGG